MRRSPLQNLAASPTMVGAITTLIVIVAVFLAYNANNGLPFVPVYRVSVDVPDAARLGEANEVRIGGNRVGVVESIEITKPDDPGQDTAATDESAVAAAADTSGTAARLNLKLDKSAEPLPQDSGFRVRYKSAFGLKFLEVTRGTGEGAPEGFVFDGTDDDSPSPSEREQAAENGTFTEQVEFDDIANTFDTDTRDNARRNLVGFGNSFAGRGASLNLAIEKLNPLFRNLRPVAQVLAAEDTELDRFFGAQAATARIVAPVAEQQANFFTAAGIAFDAITSDPEALRDTIEEGVPLLEIGTPALRRQVPFLNDVATFSRILRPGVRDLRFALPSLLKAVKIGTPVLQDSVQTGQDLEDVMQELEDLVDQPSSKVALQRLKETFDSAIPLAQHVVPAQTVCNYWNYWFTFLPEHITERDQVGFQQRVVLIQGPPGISGVNVGGVETVSVGEVQTPVGGYSGLQANGKASTLAIDPGPPPSPIPANEFQPEHFPILHGNPYGPSGQVGTRDGTECQAGQSGYVLGGSPDYRLPGQSISNPAFGIPDIPGNRGITSLYYNQDGSREFRDTRVGGRYPNP